MKIIKPSFEILSMKSPDDMLASIELAGRTCYKSEDKIKRERKKDRCHECHHFDYPEDTDINDCPLSCNNIFSPSAEPFVRSLIKSGHHSVLEHESISVRFICDRGVSHELVRHRLASFSQESTRYVKYNGRSFLFIIPSDSVLVPGEYFLHSVPGRGNIWATYDGNGDIFELPISTPVAEYIWLDHMRDCVSRYETLLSCGQKPEKARGILPNSLKTEIVMTANIREWRHVFSLRCAKAAHPQIREILLPLLEHLAGVLPVLFGDVLGGLK